LWLPGIKKKQPPWEVTLWGKHRSFADYIACGNDNRIVQRFAGWAQREKTLSAVARSVKNERRLSWSYWLIEGGRNLHCGFMTTSRDKSGRPNLLILTGKEETPGRGDNWEMFSLKCRRTWRAMAALAGEAFADMAGLQARLSALPPPGHSAEAVLEESEPDFQSAREIVRKTIRASREKCLSEKTVRIDGINTSEDDLFRYQGACREIMKITPDSVFVGGSPEKKQLILFFRQMDENDFIDLWKD